MISRSTSSRPGSLRWRLLARVSLATLLIWALAALLSYRQARHEVQELMDGQMVKTARLLLAQVGEDTRALEKLPTNMDTLRGVKKRRSELALEYQISDANGNVLLRSTNAPATPVVSTLGHANIIHNGQPWRSLIMETADGRYRVQVVLSIHSRDREALEIARKTVMPLALFMPLVIVLIYFSVRRGLKPLDDLAAEVAARSPENLSLLTPRTTLLETRPLVDALNRLFNRLTATLENERRFTADAAHELRTPLAALKVQAQVAMATRNPEQHQHALAQVIAGADRTTRLVEQLLRLARLDPLQKLPDLQVIDLGALASQTIEEANQTATARNLHLQMEIPATALTIRGDRDLLHVALRNLIDNALRYTPEGGSVTVSVSEQDDTIRLQVTDNGHGVPADELPRLAERFYRGRDVEAEGSGLGLAIVRRIAELHGARFEIDNLAAGGFVAGLYWPEPPAVPA